MRAIIKWGIGVLVAGAVALPAWKKYQAHSLDARVARTERSASLVEGIHSTVSKIDNAVSERVRGNFAYDVKITRDIVSEYVSSALIADRLNLEVIRYVGDTLGANGRSIMAQLESKGATSAERLAESEILGRKLKAAEEPGAGNPYEELGRIGKAYSSMLTAVSKGSKRESEHFRKLAELVKQDGMTKWKGKEKLGQALSQYAVMCGSLASRADYHRQSIGLAMGYFEGKK